VGRGWHRRQLPVNRRPASRDQAAQMNRRHHTHVTEQYKEQMLHRETINKSSKNRALILYKQQVHQKMKYKIKNKQQYNLIFRCETIARMGKKYTSYSLKNCENRFWYCNKHESTVPLKNSLKLVTICMIPAQSQCTPLSCNDF
jgi:hypothetical protein